MIALLFVYLGMGSNAVYNIYKLYYNNDLIPRKVTNHIMLPYLLFDVFCLALIVFAIIKFAKQKYQISLYYSCTALVGGVIFFALM